MLIVHFYFLELSCLVTSMNLAIFECTFFFCLKVTHNSYYIYIYNELINNWINTFKIYNNETVTQIWSHWLFHSNSFFCNVCISNGFILHSHKGLAGWAETVETGNSHTTYHAYDVIILLPAHVMTHRTLDGIHIRSSWREPLHVDGLDWFVKKEDASDRTCLGQRESARDDVNKIADFATRSFRVFKKTL